MESWPYIEAIPAGIRSQWETKMKSVCAALDIRPEWLMVVMYTESKLNPQASNGSAVGFIQFTVSTSKLIGTTKAELLKMNHVQQLDMVQKYLQRMIDWKGKLRSIGDVYVATFAPAFIRSSNATICYAGGTAAYRGNKPLDFDQDGNITRKDVVSYIHDKIPLEDRQSVAFNPGSSTPSGLTGGFSWNWFTTSITDSDIYGEPQDPTAGDPGGPAPEGFDGMNQEETHEISSQSWFPFALVGVSTLIVGLLAIILFPKKR